MSRLAIIVCLLSACAAETAEKSNALADPSSPRAEEAPVPPLPKLADGPPAAAHVPHMFACPMHANIKSTSPGACSICGMKLVPVEESP
jgi:hypothetical protein